MKDEFLFDDQGNIHVPKKPGLGIEMDWDLIDNCTVEHKVTELS